MKQLAHVSLFDSVWPLEESKESKNLHTTTRLPERGNPAHFKVNYQKILTYAQVVFTICKTAADSVVKGNYRKFDALLKNFGCQMTALDVHQKLSRSELCEEAVHISKLCVEKFEQIGKMFNKPPQGKCGMTMNQYVGHAGLDIQISAQFADLVVYRLLHVIHDTKLERGEEVPVTNLDPLELVKNQLEKKASGPLFSFDAWVHGLQAKESRKAALFIQHEVEKLEVSHERALLLKRMVGPAHLREATFGSNRSSILTLPQSYSVEAAVRLFQGIMIVKNKLRLSNNLIQGAVPEKVFISFPEHKILDQEEIKGLDPLQPVIVLEGYKGSGSIAHTISQIGVITLLNINCANMPQFTSMFPQDPLNDKEAEEDVASFKKREEWIKSFRADHLFCSSVGDERDE